MKANPEKLAKSIPKIMRNKFPRRFWIHCSKSIRKIVRAFIETIFRKFRRFSRLFTINSQGNYRKKIPKELLKTIPTANILEEIFGGVLKELTERITEKYLRIFVWETSKKVFEKLKKNGFLKNSLKISKCTAEGFPNNIA